MKLKTVMYYSLAATLLLLNRGTFYSAITAKNTTVAFFGFQYCITFFAFIKILASIGWHYFFFAMTTIRTSNKRFGNNFHIIFSLLSAAYILLNYSVL